MFQFIFLFLAFITVVRMDKGCPNGWSRFDDSCYFISKNLETWSSASRVCYSQGGHLVRMESKRESDYVEGLAIANSNGGKLDFWVDGTKVGNTGNWRFASNGSPIGYTDFFKGEPSGGKTREKCLIIYRAEYKWHDLPCTYFRSYICEKEIKKGGDNSRCSCNCSCFR